MCKDTIKITSPNLIIVEGIEDKIIFDLLCKQWELPNIQCIEIGGKTKLRENLNAFIKTPGFNIVKSLCIIRDANSDPKSAFQSVRDALKNLNLPYPTTHLEVAGQRPRVGIIIVPDINIPGSLEDLLLKTVQNEPAMNCVDEYFRCLRAKGIPFSDTSKARVQAFLASKSKPCLKPGEAAKKGYFPLDDDVFKNIKEFLSKLVYET